MYVCAKHQSISVTWTLSRPTARTPVRCARIVLTRSVPSHSHALLDSGHARTQAGPKTQSATGRYNTTMAMISIRMMPSYYYESQDDSPTAISRPYVYEFRVRNSTLTKNICGTCPGAWPYAGALLFASPHTEPWDAHSDVHVKPMLTPHIPSRDYRVIAERPSQNYAACSAYRHYLC